MAELLRSMHQSPSDGELPPKLWTSACRPVKLNVLRRPVEAVELATLEWVDWFNNRRLLEPIGNIPPAEAEERHHAVHNAAASSPNGRPRHRPAREERACACRS